MADWVAAKVTCISAVQQGTHAKQARAWKRWGEYSKLIGYNDLFLKSFTRHQQIKLIGVFALALHEGQFSGKHNDKLVEKTVTDFIQYVCATFRENGFPNPTFDDNAKSGLILQQLYRAFRNAEPAEEHQKAIPMSVISELGKKTILELSTAVFELTGLGIFFACRSVTARIGFSIDSDLHEKLLRRIGSRWCKNHVESDLYVFVSVNFFLFSIQNEFVVRSKTLSPILHGETVI